MSKVRIGIIGSRFQAECIAGAVKAVPEEGEVVAVASPSKGHAAGFAKRHGIPHAYTDYRELLRDPQVEMISITAPNRLHAQMATQVHGERTPGEDEAITIIEFENGAVGMVESSWNRPGGMDDSIEVFGDKGQTYADLLMGNALPTYSEVGFGYAVEKAASTKGWTYPVFEEHWNYGFPQEMRHFARCARGKETPIADGETGRVVQEVLYAAYASAGEGRKISLPFRPKGIAKPIDLWKTPGASTCAT